MPRLVDNLTNWHWRRLHCFDCKNSHWWSKRPIRDCSHLEPLPSHGDEEDGSDDNDEAGDGRWPLLRLENMANSVGDDGGDNIRDNLTIRNESRRWLPRLPRTLQNHALVI